MKILLDYFFPITAIIPTPQASTAFLKQVLIVVKPKGGVTPGVITTATTMAQVTALTNNTEAQQLFNAGMSRVKVLPANDLDLVEFLDGHESDFYTLLISSDFTDADILASKAAGGFTITSFANLVAGTADTVTVGSTVFSAQAAVVTPGAATFQAATSNDLTAASLAAQINAHPVTSTQVIATVVGAVVTLTAITEGFEGNDIALNYTDNNAAVGATKTGTFLAGGDGLSAGTFKGVIGVSSTDDDFLADQAAIPNRVAFHATAGNKAKNMFFAFGKLLSNSLTWLNQQYVAMPFADDVNTLGQANNLFDSKISFVIGDDEFGSRLALFTAGGQAIAAPYIVKNLELDMQSKALTYVSGNQPAYTPTQAALLEDELQKVMDLYINRQLIDEGTVEVRLEQENFTASSYIDIAPPTALWRIFGLIKQTL